MLTLVSTGHFDVYKKQRSLVDLTNCMRFIKISDFDFLQHSVLKINVFCSKNLRQCKCYKPLLKPPKLERTDRTTPTTISWT